MGCKQQAGAALTGCCLVIPKGVLLCAVWLQVNIRLVMLDFTSSLVAAAGSEELQQQVGSTGLGCAHSQAVAPQCVSPGMRSVTCKPGTQHRPWMVAGVLVMPVCTPGTASHLVVACLAWGGHM